MIWVAIREFNKFSFLFQFYLYFKILSPLWENRTRFYQRESPCSSSNPICCSIAEKRNDFAGRLLGQHQLSSMYLLFLVVVSIMSFSFVQISWITGSGPNFSKLNVSFGGIFVHVAFLQFFFACFIFIQVKGFRRKGTSIIIILFPIHCVRKVWKFLNIFILQLSKTLGKCRKRDFCIFQTIKKTYL